MCYDWEQIEKYKCVFSFLKVEVKLYLALVDKYLLTLLGKNGYSSWNSINKGSYVDFVASNLTNYSFDVIIATVRHCSA